MGSEFMQPRRVLLVTYRYPPLGGSGVQRAAKLARYLPQAGWRVHVLTAGCTHYPLVDSALSDDSVPGVTVHRVLGYEPAGIAATTCGLLGCRKEPGAAPGGVEDRLFWRR